MPAPDRNKPFFIDVVTASRDPNVAPVHTTKINYHSNDSRKWLAKHSYWALINGYTVHTAASEFAA